MDFRFDNFIVLKNVINESLAIKLARDLDILYEQNHFRYDTQCPDSPGFDNPCKKLALELLPIVQVYSKDKVFYQMNYARKYKFGTELPRHRDRPIFKMGLSLCLDYTMNKKSWPLYFFDETKNQEYEVFLNRGDAVLYQGHKLDHWRYPLDYQNHYQLFIMYNDTKNIYDEDETKELLNAG